MLKSGLPSGSSSVGRARPSQGRCREFESRLPLQIVVRIWLRHDKTCSADAFTQSGLPSAAQPAAASLSGQFSPVPAPTGQGAAILPEPPAQPAPPQAPAHSHYINRERSQLDFDERVLAIAEDESLPLLERVRFLAILGEHVDQFFQVRVAGLKEQAHAALPQTSPDGMTTGEQLRAIHERAGSLLERSTDLFTHRVAPALEYRGVSIARVAELDHADREFLATEFRARIFPVLTPLAVDPAHPFPYISHLSLNLAVMVRDPVRHQMRFARVKVPPLLPRFIALPDGRRFVPLEQVIAAHLDALFPGMEIVSQHPFRVTRDADLD